MATTEQELPTITEVDTGPAAGTENGPIAEYHDRGTWLLERHRQGVGSSEAPIILGVDPFGRSEADLQRKKLAAIDRGELIQTPDNAAMLRGRLFEDDCVELWRMQAERGRDVKRWPLRVHREVPLLSSADRKALSNDDYPTAPLEAKVPGFRMFREIERGGLRDYMNVQGQVHAVVHDDPGTEWAVMRADPIALLGFWIPADPSFGELVLEKVDAWWQRHIIEREPAPELPQGEGIDLSKLPKVEGKVVRPSDPELVSFLEQIGETYEVRKEINDFYNDLVAQVKGDEPGEGLFPVGVFEHGRVRMYHSVIKPSPRFSPRIDEIEPLIDPAKLQSELVEWLEARFGVPGPVAVHFLGEIADRVRVDVDDFRKENSPYQQVKVYLVKEAEGL